jgi:hypothetical protein
MDPCDAAAHPCPAIPNAAADATPGAIVYLRTMLLSPPNPSGRTPATIRTRWA